MFQCAGFIIKERGFQKIHVRSTGFVFLYKKVRFSENTCWWHWIHELTAWF